MCSRGSRRRDWSQRRGQHRDGLSCHVRLRNEPLPHLRNHHRLFDLDHLLCGHLDLPDLRTSAPAPRARARARARAFPRAVPDLPRLLHSRLTNDLVSLHLGNHLPHRHLRPRAWSECEEAERRCHRTRGEPRFNRVGYEAGLVAHRATLRNDVTVDECSSVGVRDRP
jgi:hypothetical protein